ALEACWRNRARARRRVQLRGGARRQPARRTLCGSLALARISGFARLASGFGLAQREPAVEGANEADGPLSSLARAYPFTEPAVSPWTMYFWKTRTSSTAGSAPRKPEAAITE